MSSPPLLEVNEGTTGYLTVGFLDKDDALATPASASYRVDDLATGTEIRDDTALVAASEIEIVLDADTDNNILDDTLEVETHVVTVNASYGASGKVAGHYFYNVRNLRFLP